MCPLEMLDAHQKFEWRRFREAAQEGAVDVTTIALATLRHIDGVCMLDVLEHLDLCSKCVVVDPSKSQSTTQYLFSALLTTQRDTQVWQSHPHMTRWTETELQLEHTHAASGCFPTFANGPCPKTEYMHIAMLDLEQ